MCNARGEVRVKRQVRTVNMSLDKYPGTILTEDNSRSVSSWEMDAMLQGLALREAKF